MILPEAWAELESETAFSGEYRRRIHPEAIADMFLIVHKPGNTRGLLIEIDLSNEADRPELPEAGGIALQWLEAASGRVNLEITLRRPNFADLFDALVTDVAEAAAVAVSQEDTAERVIGRVRRWQTFLRQAAEGLGEELQRGLFGEITFLKLYLLPILGAIQAVTSWLGPAGANQDFQLGATAVEVKTSTTKQHQVLQIASERQLDTTGIEKLVIFHLSVDARDGTGTTLPDIVSETRSQLASEPLAAGSFEDLLFKAGYLDVHTHLYRTGYSMRVAHLFLVRDGFPRIVEADCPLGVGDVRYSIAVSSLSPFAIDVETLRTYLRGRATRD